MGMRKNEAGERIGSTAVLKLLYVKLYTEAIRTKEWY